jgi:cytochrome c-type biogenesis protein CcmH/NrfG
VTRSAGFAVADGALPLERVGSIAERAAPFLVGGLVTGIVAADHGGYWPTAWGWTAIALAWIGAVALVMRVGRVGGLEVTFVGALGALTAWTGLSAAWTSSTTQTVLTVERSLVYVAGAVAVVGVVRARTHGWLLWGVWAGSTAASLYGLATRLLPDHLGSADPIAGNRLSAPVGYWNGLGLLAAIAIALAFGFSVFGGALPLRALAAASLPLLLPTLYLTFSRGAWVALLLALAALLVLSDRRLTILATLLVLAAPAALGIWLTERAKALHVTTADLAEQTHAGHRVLWQLLLGALAAAALIAALGIAQRRITLPRAVGTGFGVVVAVAAVAAVVVAVVHYGGPSGVVHEARHSIEGGAPGGSDLNSRLFSLSSNGRLDEWNVAIDAFQAHRVFGSGAGTYAQAWARHGNGQSQILNAHNLYLETLAELGPIGLALLVIALAAPLAAAVKARRRPLVPIAAGAYVAFLGHAAYDWDWQLTGVTLAALFCAGAVLAAARTTAIPETAPGRRFGLLAVVAAAGVLSFFGLLGNRALARGGEALHDGDYARAAEAAKDARRWAPWSSQPWAQLAAVRTARGDRPGAADAYRKALAKDPDDWQLWLGLAGQSRGAARAHAVEELERLHPGAAGGTS